MNKNKDVDMDAQVKTANKIFYDMIADVYEKVDGRRTDEISRWLDEVMNNLSDETDGISLLDVGCGTGLIMKAGRKYFKHVYGMDISSGILKHIDAPSDGLACGDACFLPFKNESFDVVSCFAVLHHVYDHPSVFREAYRVLKKGGILYTDHDMDAAFMKRFYLPMKLYRRLFDMGKRYLQEKRELNRELYELSEIHSEGIDSNNILKQLKEIGFVNIKDNYHWFGINKITNKIIGKKTVRKGFAPLLSILAKK